ncbi:hypothetical protein M422DRAFT_238905 [Sphaerobolus stellatus SS14]|nr:hypothetical protein M422DRAFT_238905 [Sphaerobolus stellatus SS14]
MANEPNGNFIISSAIGVDGKLTVKTATSVGGVAIPQALNIGGPFFSQGSITISGNNLMSSMPYPSPQYPTPITLEPNDASSSGGPNGLGHLIFNEAETELIASAREISTPARGFLTAWDINLNTGVLSQSYKEIGATGAMFPFGLAVLPGKNAVIASDPDFGYVIFDLNVGQRNRSSVFQVPSQVAVCWAVYNERTGNAFLIDCGSGVISEVTVNVNLGSSLINQYALARGSEAIDSSIALVKGKQYVASHNRPVSHLFIKL